MSLLNPCAKALRPHEVDSSLHQYIDFDNQFPRLQSGGLRHTCANVTCPRCGKVRPVMVAAIRKKRITRKWSALCRRCNSIVLKRDHKIPDYTPSDFLPYIVKGSITYKNGKKYIGTICSFCGNYRLLQANSIRLKKSVSQLCCRSCAAKRRRKEPVPRKKSSGYIDIHINSLTGHIKELARATANPSTNYICEHRLVMAVHLDRPLTKDEVVHHCNGVKVDNRIENLTLLTKNTHHVGHGHPYYQQWQEAESRIRKLEAEIGKLRQQLNNV